jgi:hypothetical protein
MKVSGWLGSPEENLADAKKTLGEDFEKQRLANQSLLAPDKEKWEKTIAEDRKKVSLYESIIAGTNAFKPGGADPGKGISLGVLGARGTADHQVSSQDPANTKAVQDNTQALDKLAKALGNGVPGVPQTGRDILPLPWPGAPYR